jgi:hypothetical protein
VLSLPCTLPLCHTNYMSAVTKKNTQRHALRNGFTHIQELYTSSPLFQELFCTFDFRKESSKTNFCRPLEVVCHELYKNVTMKVLIIGFCILLRVYQSIYIETSVRNKCRCSFYCALLTLHVVFQCAFYSAVKSQFVFHQCRPSKGAESSSINYHT